MVWQLAVLAILGGLSIVPPYLGPEIGLKLGHIDSSVEIVDHVIPGTLTFLSAGTAFLLLRAGKIREDSLVLAGCLSVCMLAGVWEASSHVPLILDGGRPESPWGAVVLHSTLGFVIAVFSLVLVLRVLSMEPGEKPRAAG